jgi:hypothetical protein
LPGKKEKKSRAEAFLLRCMSSIPDYSFHFLTNKSPMYYNKIKNGRCFILKKRGDGRQRRTMIKESAQSDTTNSVGFQKFMC